MLNESLSFNPQLEDFHFGVSSSSEDEREGEDGDEHSLEEEEGGDLYHNLPSICPWTEHCRCCRQFFLPQYISNEKYGIHGCCNQASCIAFPDEE